MQFLEARVAIYVVLRKAVYKSPLMLPIKSPMKSNVHPIKVKCLAAKISFLREGTECFLVVNKEKV